MNVWRRLKVLCRNLSRRRAIEDDLVQEIHSFQAMLADDKARAGTDPSVARREAALEMGGVEQIKEGVRDVRVGITLETLVTELRQSLRALGRNKDLTVLCTLMLALGIGAATVVFSIFYAALIEPLPFRDPARLVQLWESRLNRGIDHASFAEANFWDVRALNHSFQEVAAYHYDEANLTGNGPAEKVTDIEVTAGFFRTLGISPTLGRDFSSADDRNGFDNRIVILGNRFWRSRLGADPNILGKTLRLNDRACTVVGVLPPGEPWIDDQIYQPFGYRPNTDRTSWEFDVIGRLAQGFSPDAARADLKRLAAALAESYPKEDKGIGFVLALSNSWVAGNTTRRALWVLLGAVAFLLLIACLNIANLLLARGTVRQREIAVRIALGAGRARLVRFVMLESILLSSFGAALGLALAYASLHAIQALEIRGIPRLAGASLNPWVLGFAALAAILTGVLSGVAPAWQTPAHSAAAALRDGDRQTGSRAQGRLRAALVTGEVALSFLLLVGAGLLIRSFTELMNVDRGFKTENRLVFAVSMPGSYYENGVGKRFLDRFVERLPVAEELLRFGADAGATEIVRMSLQRIHWDRQDVRWFRMLASPLSFWHHIPWLSAGNKDFDRESYLECFRLILNACDVNVVGAFGRTILHEIAAMGDWISDGEVAAFGRAALEAGARMDRRDDILSSTTLGWACRWGRLSLVELLLQNGADPYENDAEAWARPLSWARKMGHHEIVRALS